MATRTVRVGDLRIGGGAPVSVQTMTNTDTRDAAATLAQIRRCAEAGADIVRISVYDDACAAVVRDLVDQSPVPLVADIHFNHELAIKSAESGIAKVRINPGNIGSRANVIKLADCLKAHKVPVRIGVNAGSLDREILARHGGVNAAALVESGMKHARILEEVGFEDIVISYKASTVSMMVDACRLAARMADYPQHIGVTETGTPEVGIYKSAIGIGALLLDGIGDTVRVSLTSPPEEEVKTALSILRAVGLRNDFVEIIACPTCGRTCIEVEQIARRVRLETLDIREPLKVAIMGCVVNGPGEAKGADIGVAGGRDGGALFIKNEKPRAIRGDLAQVLIDEIRRMTAGDI